MQVAYDSLTIEEKRRVARDLRPSYNVRDLAALLHTGTNQIVKWTRDLKVDLGAARKRTRVRTDEEMCHCPRPASHPGFDSFCKRGETCIYCAKPERA